MSIGSRGGHTKASTGASYFIDELTEDRMLIEKVNELLRSYNTIVNCQPSENTPYPPELTYGIRMANNNRVGFFFSIHFNAAGLTDEPRGCEVVLHPNASQSTKEKAQRICNNLESLGFKNRGIKYNNPSNPNECLSELWSTNMEAMIIEVCFVNSRADVDLYNCLDKDVVARAIANGIDERISFNKDNGGKVEMSNPVNDYNEEYYLHANPDIAKAVSEGKFSSGEEHFIKYGYSEGRKYRVERPSDWSELGYLTSNPDVEKVVSSGGLESGFYHYKIQGWKEDRSYKLKSNAEFDRDKLIKEVSEIIKNF